ncbi:MAG: ABC transporter ATP-binding protein [Bdellovibrionales bacterium]|nr:ABC transporter ATP-binding protein [Bdellovibrionales bacterium]
MSSAPRKSVLSVKDLHVSYGAISAVKGISFEIFAGEIVSLIGANGAGKTTTLRAISGLLPCRGEILLNGRPTSSIAPYNLVTHGLVHSPEGRGIFLNLTVEENLKLGAYRRKDTQDLPREMEHCFELFPRLKERLKASAGTLSGGEQQMLSISRALLSKPQVLMLDEPSLGLAPRIVQQIFQIVQKLNSEGITILLVEQNARMALKVSHRAYVLETGKVRVSGEGRVLLADPQIQAAYLGH